MVQLVKVNIRSSAKSNFIVLLISLIYFTNIQKVYNLALTGMASFFLSFKKNERKKIEWIAGKWIRNKAQTIR
jgi:hypothetical protein